jgi:pimeloyl-ACP methyl ester carboxylesterase
MQLLVNDTAGLMDALKIQKADVFGYSLGSNIAEQFAITYTEKVNTCCCCCSLVGMLNGYNNV